MQWTRGRTWRTRFHRSASPTFWPAAVRSRIVAGLGIYGDLHAILGDSALADDWVRRPNADFGERSPLLRMLAGNVGDLVDVRRYVEAWRLGW